MKFLDVFQSPAARVPKPVPGEPTIRDLSDPTVATIPLEYPERLLFEPLVQAGDEVARGQVIGRSEYGNCVHATVDGAVREIKLLWTASGHHVPAVVVDRSEGEGGTADGAGSIDKTATRIERLKAAGVISPWTTPGPNMAEAGPDDLPDIRHVVIVGHDVEPTHHVQELLLRENGEDLRSGLNLLRDVAPKADIWLTVPRTSAAWASQSFGDRLKVHAVSDDYRDRILEVAVKKATGVTVPEPTPFRSCGIALMSVETALAAKAALEGRPFLQKTLTISGGTLTKPRTLRAALGTNIRALLNACEQEIPEGGRIIAGGPMMGTALFTPDTPLDKFIDGVHLQTADEQPLEVNRNCVNCGRCVRACPVNIQVNMLGRCVQFDQLAEAADYHPEACIDCGLCTFVCPARRPLVQLVNIAKTHVRRSA